MNLSNGGGATASGRKPRILFVAEHLPVPVLGGSSQRTNLLIECLNTFADVEMVPIGPPGVKALLEDHGYRVAAVLPDNEKSTTGKILRVIGFLLPGVIRYRPQRKAAETLRLLHESGGYDVIIGRYCRPSARAGVHLLPRSIIDIDDLESQKLTSWIEQHPFGPLIRPLMRPIAWRVRAAERNIIRALARAWMSAGEDVIGLPAERVDVIPNIPFYPVQEFAPSTNTTTVLFVASFDYRVNITALHRLVDFVWPLVRASAPNLQLRVVGGGLDALAQAKLATEPGVEYAGFVDDLTSEYASSMCSIVPIWEGGGSKIKVLECLALGRTCVVAAPSMRGYRDRLHDAEDLIVADDEQALVAGIVALAANDDLRHRLEKNGSQKVRAFYSREMLATRIRDSVNRLSGLVR